ncbi:MAG: MFS transporter [Desulfovibrionaceae bacterium]|nr:MFS transporter [Desulfovibrionaceae bacterium]
MSASLPRLTSPYAILALLCAAYAMSYFHRVCPAVLSVDLMNDFSLDGAAFSLISSATMLGYSLSQIPSGILSDIIGGRRTLGIFQALAGLACIGFTLCEDISGGLACRFLLGLVLAANIPAYKVLAVRVPPKDYARFTAILTCSGVLGTLLASSPLVAATSLAGWRGALMIAGCFTFVLGVSVYTLLREPESAGQEQGGTLKENIAGLKHGCGVVLRMRQYWLILAWFVVTVGCMFALVTMWWGGWLMQGVGLSREEAGLSMSIMALTPLPLALVVPWLSDSVFHSRRVFLLGAALLQTVCFGFIWLNDEPVSFAVLTALGSAMPLSISALGVMVFPMIRETVPLSVLATATGVINATAPAAAAVIQVVFGAILSSETGAGASMFAAYSQAFGFMFAISLIPVLASIIMKDTLGPKGGE